MKKQEFQRLTSRTKKAARTIQRKMDKIRKKWKKNEKYLHVGPTPLKEMLENQRKRDRAKQERSRRRMRKAEGAAVEIPSRGIRLMGCVDLPTIKEAIVQNNRFKANSEHKIQYLLMQDVELHQLGNVLIIQPKGTYPSDRQVPVSLMPVSQIEVSQPKAPRRYMSLSRRVKLLKEILKGLAGRKCTNQNAANCLCLPCRARAVKEQHQTVAQRANLIREIRQRLADCECNNASKDCNCLSCMARVSKARDRT